MYLQQQSPGAQIYLVGTPELEMEFKQFGFKLTAQNPEYIVLGYDTSLTYEKICQLSLLVRTGLPYIATHPDINCPTPDGPIPDIGALIALISASTGREPDVIIGKPYPTIVQVIADLTGLGLNQLVMVGDRLYTDIALGKAGIRTVLVLSGETRLAELPTAEFQPDLVVNNLLELYEILLCTENV
jgi:HAD superfamily hydrolase (TIGR01450 family)